MERKDFTVALLPDGYFLFYKGKPLGGNLFHRSLASSISEMAEQEIADLMNGKGFHGYLAVLQFQQRMEEKFGRIAV